MASVAELEAALAAALAKRDAASAALAGRYGRDALEAYFAADDVLLDAQRALASAKGQAHAVPIDFPIAWSKGAPLPHLLQSDHRTFLLFLIAEVDPDWDGSWVRIVGTDSEAGIAVVEFERCQSAKLGMPNDEAFHDHPLVGHGLHAYGAFKVVNSPWIAELARINSVHPHDNPESWAALTHYILGFHDSTFECLADRFRVETRQGTIVDVLKELCDRL